MNNQRHSGNNWRPRNHQNRNRNRNQNQHHQQRQHQNHRQTQQQQQQDGQPDNTGHQSFSSHQHQQHNHESQFGMLITSRSHGSGTDQLPYQASFNAPSYAPVATDQYQSSHTQMQALQQPQQQYLVQQQHQTYMRGQLEGFAEDLCGSNRSAARRALNSTYAMPISDHVYYNGYEIYNSLMAEQQGSIVGMMNSLSTCYYNPSNPANYLLDPTNPSSGFGRPGVEFGDIPGSIDKHEMIQKMNNDIFHEIGHNLDCADGSYQRDAQSVQATLGAANRTRPTSSSHLTTHQSFMSRSQSSTNEHFSSSSSSPSITRPSEISCPSSFNQFSDEQQNQHQQYNQFMPNQQRFPRFSKSFQFRRPENKNLPRPQDDFLDKIDNSVGPFVPIIKEKPNATIPLCKEPKRDQRDNSYYDHPYSLEIEQFQLNPDLLLYRDPMEPSSLDSSPIIMVETLEELESMCTHIEGQREFAVDVEHHSYRSYLGLTCLLQISTRTQDFVIDAIKLRSDLQRLNKSFTNPEIVKVFHGADCDIIWLQRDFGVYVVNMFDTSRAAKLMKFPHLSLAFLMRHYCNIDPDKSYQLADWRERPLPPMMIQYARSDTHYLLYIYDRLRNDLLTKDNTPGVGQELLRSVFQKGKEICLKRYEKPPFTENSYLSVLKKSRIPFNAKQMYALKEMYAWRDRVGRDLDESVGYVLPNSMMVRIAEALPREPQGITALVKPVPQILNKYLSEVHAIILRALDIPLDEKSKLMADNPMSVNPSLRSIDLDNVSHKQDIAHSAGVQENSLPNLLDDKNLYNHSTNGRTNGYEYDDNSTYRNNNQNPSTLYRFVDPSYNKRDNPSRLVTGGYNTIEHFVPPYERYKESTR